MGQRFCQWCNPALLILKLWSKDASLLLRLCVTTPAYARLPWMVTASRRAANRFWTRCSITCACKVCWIGCRRIWRGENSEELLGQYLLVGSRRTLQHGTRWTFCYVPTKPTVVSCETKAFNGNTFLLFLKAQVCKLMFSSTF